MFACQGRSIFPAMNLFIRNEQPLYRSDQVPRHLHRFTLSNAQVAYQQFARAQLLRQGIVGNGFSVWLHHCWVEGTQELEWEEPHDRRALIYVVNGAMEVEVAPDKLVGLSENTYRYLAWAGQRRYRLYVNGSLSAFWCIDLGNGTASAEFAAAGLPVPNGKTEKPRAEALPMYTRIRDALEDILHGSADPYQQRWTLGANVRNLLLWYVADDNKSEQQGSSTSQQEILMHRLEAYLEVHLDQPLTVEQLARHMGVSRSGLQRVAQRHYHKGVYELLTDMRIREAKRLLRQTTLSVSAIAVKVSDMTFSAFCAAFKKHTGMTPRQYRKNGGQEK